MSLRYDGQCLCSWHNCKKYAKGFVDDETYSKPIRIRFGTTIIDDPQSVESIFFAKICNHFNNMDKLQQIRNTKQCEIVIASHHYTRGQVTEIFRKTSELKKQRATEDDDDVGEIIGATDLLASGILFNLPNQTEADVQKELNRIVPLAQTTRQQQQQQREGGVKYTARHDTIVAKHHRVEVAERRVGRERAAIMAKMSPAELAKKIDEMRKENQQLEAMILQLERTKQSHDSSDSEEEEQQIFDNALNKAIIVGGLSRLTILNEKYHEVHKDTAGQLFGFLSLSEYKEFVKCTFPDVDVNDTFRWRLERDDNNEIKSVMTPQELSPFECCTAALMFLKAIPVRSVIGRIFGMGISNIGKVIVKWSRRWGKVGEYLSILPMPEWYFDLELPDEYAEPSDLCHTAALVDTKDIMIETERSNEMMLRFIKQRNNNAAARCLTWSTPMGLVFEHTKLYGVQADERCLVELHGSLGHAYAEIFEWKDWTRLPENQTKVRQAQNLETALDSVRMVRSREQQEQVQEPVVAIDENLQQLDLDERASDSSDDDDSFYAAFRDVENDNDNIGHNTNSDDAESVEDTFPDNATALVKDAFHNVSPLAKAILNNAVVNDDKDEEESVSAPQVNGAPVGNTATMARELWRKRREELARLKRTGQVDEANRNHQKRNATAEKLKAEAEKTVRNSPQSDPANLVGQLETLERLHRAYENGKMKKTTLSFYLYMTVDYRMDLLHWLGSDLVGEDYQPSYGDNVGPPQVALRLEKIPRKKQVLSGKEFVNTDRFYPNNNWNRCPVVLGDHRLVTANEHKKKQWGYTSGERYLSGLKDVVTYQNVPLLPYMIEWSHAMMNLTHHPHRPPGQQSGIQADQYFDTPKPDKNRKRKRNY